MRGSERAWARGRAIEPRVPGAWSGGGLAHGHWIRQPDARVRGQPRTRRHFQDHRRHAVVSAPRPVAAALASPCARPGETHEGARTMSRAWPVIALVVAAVLMSTGCGRRAEITAGCFPPHTPATRSSTQSWPRSPERLQPGRAIRKPRPGPCSAASRSFPQHRRSCPTALAHTRSNFGCRRS